MNKIHEIHLLEDHFDGELTFKVTAHTEAGRLFTGRFKVTEAMMWNLELLEYLQRRMDDYRLLLDNQGVT